MPPHSPFNAPTAVQADARKIVSLIDLTSLRDVETETDIRNLCARAATPLGPVAAVCVWPKWVSLCAHTLRDGPTAVATVVNFPHGRFPATAVLEETLTALGQGADEIDLVLPYADFRRGKTADAAQLVSDVAECCHAVGAHLKVIIESGELRDPRLIRQASDLCLANGADFIKTSTGKAFVNATPEAAAIMLQAIADSGQLAGFKAAGGIGSLAQAQTYLQLAESILGPQAITPARFRFGASSLLDVVCSSC